MTRNLTARVASIAFGVELAFACAIPIAYLHLFDIDEGGDRAVVIGVAAALYVVRTAGLITWLALLLRPIDRWLKQPDAAGAQLTLGAARAAYDTPLAFSIVWATTWLVFALMTVVSWGLYGIFLHSGQTAMADKNYQQWMRRGVEWAATGAVSPDSK